MNVTRQPTPTAALTSRLVAALHDETPLDDLGGTDARNARDRFAALLEIYALHTAPVETVGDAVRYQHHPVIAELKRRLESAWLAELATDPVPADLPTDPVDAMRALAARDRLPDVYRWLAKHASYPELVEFLSLEGGPDAGFDDLVAACQVGLAGSAKLELANNYWDEMGNGDGDAVHTELHHRMATALGLTAVPLDAQPTEGLARTALCGLLATNRWLQPEMLGALGLTELQAGPRCRMVLRAFDRLGAPAAAYPFYEIHADVDPRHGKDWLEKAIAPLVDERPDWGPRIVRGAWWRNATNAAFFTAVTPAAAAATRAA